MPNRGPLTTLLAVAAAGVAVVATNAVLTPGPSDVEQSTAALSSSSTGYSPSANAPAAVPVAPERDAVGEQAPVAPVRYDGRTAGDEATVQVTVENGQAKAYICNPATGIDTWVRGSVEDGRMRLTGDDGAAVDATSDGTAVFGTASAGGKTWPFAAAVSRDAAPTPESEPTPVEQPEQPDVYGGY